MLTDTHTHLYSEAFDSDRSAVVQRALDAGVSRFFIPAIDSDYTQKMLDLEAAFPKHVFLMMGLHPTHVNENAKQELARVKSWLDKRKFYAVGEIGIDLYWDKTYLKAQQEAFQTQVRWAKERKMPINIHCREAFDEVFEILESEKSPDLRGIFHCFTGNLAQAQKALSYNLKLGIGGVVTFKNGQIDRFLNKIPLSEIVLETDAPYLAPTPFRGKRNESAYLQNIVEKLVEIYGLSPEQIARKTTENALEVFDI
jgi:TatD DNase family protein